jgi:hypothetical protein
MAKKAKRVKAKKAGRPQSTEKKARNVPLATVVAFVQWLEENGHTKDFLQTLGTKRVTVSALTFGRARSFIGQKQPDGVYQYRRGAAPPCPRYRAF